MSSIFSGKFRKLLPVKMIHTKARCDVYPMSQQRRFPVPTDKVPWTVDYPEYDPPDFTADVVKKGPLWADPDIARNNVEPARKIKFNQKDGLINRVSFTGEYKLQQNIPLNPMGRTGLTGRGFLGKWGPNHAADPIVTRWFRKQNGAVLKSQKTQKPILQFVAVQRKDSGEWAIPGGMVDAGEHVSLTMKREFGEEALDSLSFTPKKKEDIKKAISELFSEGKPIYEGYVDDPRNTDNAWMETVAMNFHDEDGTSVSQLPLQAGDDAGSVKWMDISSELSLYANHTEFLKEVVVLRSAHW